MTMENMFENSAKAFAYKSDAELKNAFWLFKAMGANSLVSIGSKAILAAIKLGLPVEGILKKTLYRQFVGGESLPDTTPLVEKLKAYGVDVILDYGAEAKTGEKNFDMTTQEFINAVRYAGEQRHVPFVSIKTTALGRFSLLEKLNDRVILSDDELFVDTSQMDQKELAEWERVLARVFAICEAGTETGVGVLIDAEESWIQTTIDGIAMLAMKKFNVIRPVVFNTIQLYRHDRLGFLKLSHSLATRFEFKLAVKLVRGAYMEKEAAWANAHGTPTAIQPTKEATDHDYDQAVRYCLESGGQIAVMVASHNERSTILATEILGERRPEPAQVSFSQLYGMSDHITFNLASAGYNTSKYVPYGPVKDVIPYLLRRAQENTSVAGQTGREALLLEREMSRRRLRTFFSL